MLIVIQRSLFRLGVEFNIDGQRGGVLGWNGDPLGRFGVDHHLVFADPSNVDARALQADIFEQLGYEIKALDRVRYADLSKKNVERGKWRFLSEKEVRLLKYLNASYK